jgi:AcrR family transcriptional regulator
MPSDDPPAAVGRDAVVEALLEAAEAEFLDVGVAAASVRRIAARARVNHGLIHRHFGSKAGLVTAVLERLARQTASAFDRGDDPDAVFDGASPFGRHLRVLARAAIDNVDMRTLQSSHPVAERLVARLEDQLGLAEDEARRTAAHLMALTFGFQLFAPFIFDATGADESVVQQDLIRAAVTLARAEGSAPPDPG